MARLHSRLQQSTRSSSWKLSTLVISSWGTDQFLKLNSFYNFGTWNLNWIFHFGRQLREIDFQFRSAEAQGLLLYHTLRNPPMDEPKYELYVLLEGGELKTVYVFGANETTLLVGKGKLLFHYSSLCLEKKWKYATSWIYVIIVMFN